MLITRTCEVCGANFTAARKSARYCGGAHRNQAFRQRQADARAELEAQVAAAAAAGTDDQSSAELGGFVERATRTELAAAKQERSAAGLAAIALARRIDHPEREGGSALAALVREHRRALEGAVAGGAGAEVDLVDELERKREERRRAGSN